MFSRNASNVKALLLVQYNWTEDQAKQEKEKERNDRDSMIEEIHNFLQYMKEEFLKAFVRLIFIVLVQCVQPWDVFYKLWKGFMAFHLIFTWTGFQHDKLDYDFSSGIFLMFTWGHGKIQPNKSNSDSHAPIFEIDICSQYRHLALHPIKGVIQFASIDSLFQIQNQFYGSKTKNVK